MRCVKIPPRFGVSTKQRNFTQCRLDKFLTGRTQRIDLDLDPQSTMQLGAMVQYLGNVAGAVLYEADLNDFCGTILTRYSARYTGTVCSQSFPLFGKEFEGRTNNASHVTFLGNAKVRCHGQNELYVVSRLCVAPCMIDASASKCCWIPASIAQLFQYCPYVPHCCPDTPPPTPPPLCVDNFPTCPKLKAQLDRVNGSCSHTDVGQATGIAAYNGMHLVDQCCASCQLDHCAKCIADGNSRGDCAAIGVCKCSLSAACLRCMSFNDRFTRAKCASYGINCTERNCSQVPSARRRAQAGAAAAQVAASPHSSAVFHKLMGCLAGGASIQTCVSPVAPSTVAATPSAAPTASPMLHSSPTKCADQHDSGLGQPCAAYGSYCADPVLGPTLKQNCKETCGLCATIGIDHRATTS